MTYSDRVKAGKEIIERMEGLSEDTDFTFRYKNEMYKLKCYSVYDDGRRSYAIDKVASYMGGMNIENRFGSKLGPTSLTLYTYDMMGQKATYKMDMSSMEVLTPKEV
jgi:hypothetical protein